MGGRNMRPSGGYPELKQDLSNTDPHAVQGGKQGPSTLKGWLAGEVHVHVHLGVGGDCPHFG